MFQIQSNSGKLYIAGMPPIKYESGYKKRKRKMEKMEGEAKGRQTLFEMGIKATKTDSSCQHIDRAVDEVATEGDASASGPAVGPAPQAHCDEPSTSHEGNVMEVDLGVETAKADEASDRI